MSAFSAIAFFPLWAISLTVGVSALRLGRSIGRGLVVICFGLALWSTAVALLVNPSTIAWAERLLPSGMLLAAAFLHAALDVRGATPAAPSARNDLGRSASEAPQPWPKTRVLLGAAYAFGIAVGVAGMADPRLIYGPAAIGAGPIFWPLAAIAASSAIALKVWLFRLAFSARGPARHKAVALAFANALGTIGGGGAIALRIFGLAPIEIFAPFLLASVLLAAYAVVIAEKGRHRDVLVQGLVVALWTALLSSIALVAFYKLLPSLAPDASWTWLAITCLFAALPMEPARALVVERLSALVFRRPIGVRDLTSEIERQETAREQAEGLAELGRLASAVAHEIRNPLGVILAQARLLEREGASPERVSEIRSQVDRSKRFLDDLLRFAKPRPLDLRDVDLAPVVELAASNVVSAMRQAKTESADRAEGLAPFRIEAPSAPVFVEADRHGALDVVTALLHNAAIAVDGRERARVVVRIAARPNDIEIQITDNGPGVPPEIEGRLFDLFATGRGRDDRHPGTGIGLALARRWVERHGGSVRHERPREGGARFVVDWPRKPRV